MSTYMRSRWAQTHKLRQVVVLGVSFTLSESLDSVRSLYGRWLCKSV